MFSVGDRERRAIKYRCVVYHSGHDSGAGSWLCNKDGDDGCSHVTKARHYLQQLVQRDPSARDPVANSQTADGALFGLSVLFPKLTVGVLDFYMIGARSARSCVAPISHLPILPPIWALLPGDSQNAYEQALPVLQVPSAISLDEGARCVCGSSRRLMDETTLRKCVVYTLINAQQTFLEVQPCQKCPAFLRRSIGPDGRQLGLFNLNNAVLFTHDLLEDYTASFTSSETPFSAWVSVMRKRYARSSLPFCHEAIFRNAWFSYSRLQQLDGDMKCPKCGPAPEDVIWDGVSLSFHRKHLLPSLRPPTTVHDKSIIRESRYRVQAPIENLDLRRSMRKIVEMAIAPSSDSNAAHSADSAVVQGSVPGIEKATHDMASVIELVFRTHNSLKLVNESLASCFYSRISLIATNSGVSQRREYINLFIQVCTIMDALLNVSNILDRSYQMTRCCKWCQDRRCLLSRAL